VVYKVTVRSVTFKAVSMC